MSIFRTETIITVSSFDLEEFIQEKWGLSERFEILETPNDSEHKFRVTGVVNEYGQEDVDRIKADANCTIWELGTVLDALCEEGQIEPGTYLVEVSW